MEQISGEMIFWLLALGVFVGWFAQLVMGKSGFGLIPNLIGGSVGSLIIGLLALQLQLPGSLLFGLLGCLAILFIANVFSVDSVHDNGMQISKDNS